MAGFVLLGCPVLSAVVAWLLSSKDCDFADCVIAGVIVGLLVLFGAYMTPLANDLGPMILAGVPYAGILAGGAAAGFMIGKRSSE